MLPFSTRLRRYPWSVILVGLCVLAVVGGYAWSRLHERGSLITDPACGKANEAKGGCIISFPVHAVPAVHSEITLSPSGDTLYALDGKAHDHDSAAGSQLVAWKTSDGAELWRRAIDGYVQSLAIAPAGDKLVAWSMDATATIRLLSLPDGKLLGQTPPISFNIGDVAFNDAGSEISFTPSTDGKMTARLQDGQLMVSPVPLSPTGCYGNVVGFGYLGEVTSRDGKVSVISVPNYSVSKFHFVWTNTSVSTKSLLDAICKAPFVAFVSPPPEWPDIAEMYATFSPDNKRLAIVYSLADTEKGYGGLVIEIRDLSHLADKGRASSVPLIASFPIEGSYPDLGWSQDGHRLAVIYETTASRRARGGRDLEDGQARIYSIP